MAEIEFLDLNSGEAPKHAPSTLERLADQRWQSIEDNPVTRTGVEMARRFTDRGNFKTLLAAVDFFNAQAVGAFWKTGVSAYERIQ